MPSSAKIRNASSASISFLARFSWLTGRTCTPPLVKRWQEPEPRHDLKLMRAHAARAPCRSRREIGVVLVWSAPYIGSMTMVRNLGAVLLPDVAHLARPLRVEIFSSSDPSSGKSTPGEHDDA